MKKIAVFWPEWCACILLACLDAVWSRHIGFRIKSFMYGTVFVWIGLYFWLLFRLLLLLRPSSSLLRKAALGSQALAVMISLTAGICILSYLSSTPAFPLVDDRLSSIDKAMGFDWWAWHPRFNAMPRPLHAVMGFCYTSIVFQFFLLIGWFSATERPDRLRQAFWLNFLALGICVCVATLLPALGPLTLPFEKFNFMARAGAIHDMQILRAAGPWHFRMTKMTGLVTFPSYHTACAVFLPYVFRRIRFLFPAILALNLMMLPGIPFFGNHYVVDMLAGIAVALISIALERFLSGRGR